MKGYRVAAKGLGDILDICTVMIADYEKFHAKSDRKIRLFARKQAKNWISKHGRPGSKNMSGFHSFVIQVTAI